MLFQVGGEGTRPTFFEMAAAQQLPSSLRAALTYSLGVLALRRPFIHKILDYEDEFFALLMLVLETHSLRTTDASFSECLYGLRRRSIKMRVKTNNKLADSSEGIQRTGLEKRQKIMSVVFLVVLPYFRSKLHAVYNREREAALQATLWGHGDDRFGDVVYIDGSGTSVSRNGSDEEETARARTLKRIKKIIGACYPWLHAGNEGLSFAYQLLYLLDATGFYSLGLHALGVHVCRATGQELNPDFILMLFLSVVSAELLGLAKDFKYLISFFVYLQIITMDTSSRISKIRSRERERLRGPPWLKTIQGALLSCTYAVLDYAQTGLIAAVFIFKMMEWWYQSAEERMSAPTVYPPPPPPAAPKVAKEGIPLLPDKTLCPLCSQKRANPSVLTVSGFVFCYSCIFKYVSQYKRCPVTLMSASVDEIRRLFHDV